MRPRPAWRIAAGLGSAASAAVVVATTITGVVRAYSPVPYTDAWPAALGFLNRLADGDGRVWFAQFNEHWIVTARALIWLDARVFGGRDLLTTAMLPALAACLVLVLCGRGQAGWRAGIVAALIFSWAQSQNFTQPFQTQFFLVYLFAAMACASYAAHAARGATRPPFVAMAQAGLAAASMANGVFAAPVLVAQGIAMRRPWREIAWLAAAAAGITAVFLSGYVIYPVAGTWTDMPGARLRYLFALLGGPFWTLTGRGRLAVAAGVATVVAAAASAILWWRGGQPARGAALLGMAAFCLVSALSVARGRAAVGFMTAFSPRYALIPLMLWSVLLLLAWGCGTVAVRRGATLAGAVLVLALMPLQWRALRRDPSVHARELGLVAHMAGLDRPELVITVFGPADYARYMREADRAARDRRGFFASVGWSAAALAQPGFEGWARCPVEIETVTRDAQGIVAGGRARGTGMGLVLLLDKNSTLVGMGLSGEKHSGWTGFAREVPERAEILQRGGCRKDVLF